MDALAPLAAAHAPALSLVISLAFGLGQVGIGMLMLRRGARHWRTFKSYLLMALGAGFALSGVTELVVSGAEALGALTGSPDPGQFQVVRRLADDALAAGLALAGVAVALFPIWQRFIPNWHPTVASPEEPS
ncbi:MAG TPA: hypothetical protein VGR57_18535 [Ktedonobacterales bacterium]|nr:hypothetical protein [Ktedonobacterales bacterium]